MLFRHLMHYLPRREIAVPLTVMLLLTILLGATVYQLTGVWKRELVETRGRMTEAVILANIQQKLARAQDDLARGDEAMALESWQGARDQYGMLRNTRNMSEALHELAPVFQGEQATPRPDRMRVALRNNFLLRHLASIQAQLDDLQRSSRIVTLAVTLSMVGLGAVLMVLTIVDLNRMISKLAASRDLTISIQEEERRRIAQDLHDEIIQSLIDIRRDYQPEKVDSLVEGIRRICHNLKPQILDDLGLAAAIRFLAEDLQATGTVVSLNLDEAGLAQLPKRYALPVFRMMQESLSNVRRHAGASQVMLSLVYNPAESPVLRGTVQDNGRGFDTRAKRHNLGLSGLSERAESLNGHARIESQPGQGTRLVFVVPVSPSDPVD